MRIRSITCFAELGHPLRPDALAAAGSFLRAARAAFEADGFEVQSTRLAAPPLRRALRDPEQVVDHARALDAAVAGEGVGYAAMGPVCCDDPPEWSARIPDALAATENVFAAAEIATPAAGADPGAARRAADVIARSATIRGDGLGNLRFAALANVPPAVPFLPAAYHAGGDPVFAVAVEAAELAVAAFEGAASPADASARLRGAIETQGARLAARAASLPAAAGAPAFAGIDFSLAPFPEASRSIGAALEALGLPAVGLAGSLAAVALAADALDRAAFPRAGLCGVFLPVLEDDLLARRGAEGRLGLDALLLYASVCGTGLDTVPLPGDASPGALAAILLDVAALALRLDKPLTARLMPMPGRAAGEEVAFDFPYFASGRVLECPAQPLLGALGGDGRLPLAPRRR